jgi:hypothetical protein
MQRRIAIRGAGVDARVKTLYSSLHRFNTHFPSLKASIMNSQHVVSTHRPAQGRIAFARAAAVKLQGMRVGNLRPRVSFGDRRLDLGHGLPYPGEGSA